MKTCPRCQRNQEESRFCRDSSRRDGLCVYCRECDILRRREYSLRNRERERERLAQWYRDNQEEHRKRALESKRRRKQQA